jgi:hypothetical protein
VEWILSCSVWRCTARWSFVWELFIKQIGLQKWMQWRPPNWG